MITAKNTINDEIARILSRENAYLPISREYFEESFPSGPDGAIIVEGKNGDEIVSGLKTALSEISGMPLDELCSFTDCPFLRMDELGTIDMYLSFLGAGNHRYGLGLSGPCGDKGRVSVFFKKSGAAPRKAGGVMPARRGNGQPGVPWRRVEGMARDIYNAEKDRAWDTI